MTGHILIFLIIASRQQRYELRNAKKEEEEKRPALLGDVVGIPLRPSSSDAGLPVSRLFPHLTDEDLPPRRVSRFDTPGRSDVVNPPAHFSLSEPDIRARAKFPLPKEPRLAATFPVQKLYQVSFQMSF